MGSLVTWPQTVLNPVKTRWKFQLGWGRRPDPAQLSIGKHLHKCGGFELLMIGVEETINKPETIDANISGIERRIIRGTDEHPLLKKGNETKVSVKAVSLLWMRIYIQYTVNDIINK